MYRILDGIANIEGLRIGRVYVIEAPDGLTLVDTSAPGALPQIEKDLLSAGHQIKDIKRILLTHAHWDHYGSLAALKEVTGAQVYVHHRYESAVISGEKQPMIPPYSQLNGLDRAISAAWVRPNLRHKVAVEVDYELREGDRLDEVLPGLEVVDMPGHSPGQCGFWQPERGLFFGGDVLMSTPSGRLLLPMVAGTPDLGEAKRSIHKVAEMNVTTLCLGHGSPCIVNAAPTIKAFASKLG